MYLLRAKTPLYLCLFWLHVSVLKTARFLTGIVRMATRNIWERCDGEHTLSDLLIPLEKQTISQAEQSREQRGPKKKKFFEDPANQGFY